MAASDDAGSEGEQGSGRKRSRVRTEWTEAQVQKTIDILRGAKARLVGSDHKDRRSSRDRAGILVKQFETVVDGIRADSERSPNPLLEELFKEFDALKSALEPSTEDGATAASPGANSEPATAKPKPIAKSDTKRLSPKTIEDSSGASLLGARRWAAQGASFVKLKNLLATTLVVVALVRAWLWLTPQQNRYEESYATFEASVLTTFNTAVSLQNSSELTLLMKGTPVVLAVELRLDGQRNLNADTVAFDPNGDAVALFYHWFKNGNRVAFEKDSVIKNVGRGVYIVETWGSDGKHHGKPFRSRGYTIQ